MKFSDLSDGDEFRIKDIDEHLIKRGKYALRYNNFGVFLGKLEMTRETSVIKKGNEDE
jgi:hypothetical protein